MSAANILCLLTGSIAAYKACEVISQLVQRGHQVRAVATEAALKFVGPATLEGLTGHPVNSELFAPGAALEHIQLTRWADVVLVCPATANTINRFAAGLADGLPGALFLAHDRAKPWLMAPAMNPVMWSHPATVAAVARLREWGVRFVPVEEGRTACGETGAGRLAEPWTVVAAVEAVLVAPPPQRWRVLVTGGGTIEPIDGIRVMTNTSTGATGAGVVEHLRRSGHEVVFLRGRAAVRPGVPGPEEEFGSYAELDAALGRWLGGTPFDAVIHAAAVSDFGVAAIEVDGRRLGPGAPKLDSNSQPVLRLRPNPKLLDGLRSRSANPRLAVVAFKLTCGAAAEDARRAVRELFLRARPDLVVHNDLAARAADGRFPADIHRPDGTIAAQCRDRGALGPALAALLAPLIPPAASQLPSS